MKTIAKEKIQIGQAVVFDEDGVRLLDTSSDFKVFALAARYIEQGEEVEFNMCESNKDFLVPSFKRQPIFTNGV